MIFHRCVRLRKYYPCFKRLSTYQLLDHSLSLGSEFADGGEHVTPGDKEMFVGLSWTLDTWDNYVSGKKLRCNWCDQEVTCSLS